MTREWMSSLPQKTSGFGEAKQTPKTKQEGREGYTSEDSEVPRAVPSAGSNASIA